MRQDKLNKYMTGDFELKQKEIIAYKELNKMKQFLIKKIVKQRGGASEGKKVEVIANSQIEYFDDTRRNLDLEINDTLNKFVDDNQTSEIIENIKKAASEKNVKISDGMFEELMTADRQLLNSFKEFNKIFEASGVIDNKDGLSRELLMIQQGLFKLQVKIIFSKLKQVKIECEKNGSIDITPLFTSIREKVDAMNKFMDEQAKTTDTNQVPADGITVGEKTSSQNNTGNSNSVDLQSPKNNVIEPKINSLTNAEKKDNVNVINTNKSIEQPISNTDRQYNVKANDIKNSIENSMEKSISNTDVKVTDIKKSKEQSINNTEKQDSNQVDSSVVNTQKFFNFSDSSKTIQSSKVDDSQILSEDQKLDFQPIQDDVNENGFPTLGEKISTQQGGSNSKNPFVTSLRILLFKYSNILNTDVILNFLSLTKDPNNFITNLKQINNLIPTGRKGYDEFKLLINAFFIKVPFFKWDSKDDINLEPNKRYIFLGNTVFSDNRLFINFDDVIKDTIIMRKLLGANYEGYNINDSNENTEINESSQVIFIGTIINKIINLLNTNDIERIWNKNSNNKLLLIYLYNNLISKLEYIYNKFFNKQTKEIISDSLQQYYLTLYNNNSSVLTFVKVRQDSGHVNPRFNIENNNNNLTLTYKNFPSKITKNLSDCGTKKCVPIDPEELKQSKVEKYYIGPINGYFDQSFKNSDIANSDNCGILILNKLIKGENVIVIGNGQSGSGKTSSLITLYNSTTKKEDVGILPLICNKLPNDFTKIKSTMLDIYLNYEDLLWNSSSNLQNEILERHNLVKPIEINNKYNIEFSRKDNIWIDNSLQKDNTLGLIINKAFDKREIEPTKNNPNSSRSHVVVLLELYKGDTEISKFVICDLAGVEDVFTCNISEILLLNDKYAKDSDKYKENSGKLTSFSNFECSPEYNLSKNYIDKISEQGGKIDETNSSKIEGKIPGFIKDKINMINDIKENIITLKSTYNNYEKYVIDENNKIIEANKKNKSNKQSQKVLPGSFKDNFELIKNLDSIEEIDNSSINCDTRIIDKFMTGKYNFSENFRKKMETKINSNGTLDDFIKEVNPFNTNDYINIKILVNLKNNNVAFDNTYSDSSKLNETVSLYNTDQVWIPVTFSDNKPIKWIDWLEYIEGAPTVVIPKDSETVETFPILKKAISMNTKFKVEKIESWFRACKKNFLKNIDKKIGEITEGFVKKEDNFKFIQDTIRLQQLIFNCKIRRMEGYLINNSLKQMQLFINNFIINKESNKFANIINYSGKIKPLLHTFPNINFKDKNNCNNKNYMFNSQYDLFSHSDKEYNQNPSEIIMKLIFNKNENINTYVDKQIDKINYTKINKYIKPFGLDINKTTLVIFTVINLSATETVNNPPTPPYINVNKLKQMYNIINYIKKNKIELEEKKDSKLKEKFKNYYKDFIDNYLLYNPFYFGIISTDEKNPKNSDIESKYRFIKSYLENDIPKSYLNIDDSLKDFINIIDGNNSATLIGTIEFTKFAQPRDNSFLYYNCDDIDHNINYDANIIENNIDNKIVQLFINPNKTFAKAVGNKKK
jgi:hypothetical protein